MKKYIVKITLLLSIVTATFSCSDSYDDSRLWEELNSLADRVSKLEGTLSQMNRDIQSMQVLVEAMQGRIYVTNVVETGTGYRISFSNGNVVEVNNAADGLTPHIGANGNWWIGTTDTGVKAAGTDGVDGLTPHIGANGNWWIGTTDTGVKAAGSDGINGLTPYIGENGNWWIGTVDTGVSATGINAGIPSDVPIIGVDLYDGEYYWTITINGIKTWLLNTDGNMIPVVGNNAMNYRPIIQVNANGYWVISYDGGITFEYILDVYGQYVSATGSSCNCETFFLSVTYHDGILVLVLVDGTVVTIDTNGNSGGDHDDRLDDVVPPELQDAIGVYMPIYPGKNPPMVEGAYYIDPFVTVYCEDYGRGGFAPGDRVSSETIRFSNQNTTNNTLDFAQYSSSGNSSEEGSGAFISGHGDNFTAFFNTIGVSNGISTKTALVISGTKTSSGIKDLYYAFVMVEKGYDPNHQLMEEGVFRVFKDQDGLSVNTSWSGARSLEGGLPTTEWGIYSFVHATE